MPTYLCRAMSLTFVRLAAMLGTLLGLCVGCQRCTCSPSPSTAWSCSPARSVGAGVQGRPPGRPGAPRGSGVQQGGTGKERAAGANGHVRWYVWFCNFGPLPEVQRVAYPALSYAASTAVDATHYTCPCAVSISSLSDQQLAVTASVRKMAFAVRDSRAGTPQWYRTESYCTSQPAAARFQRAAVWLAGDGGAGGGAHAGTGGGGSRC